MFRATDPQLSLLECQYLISAAKRLRLERSWAHAFRTVILPLIDEEAFRDAFHESTGRPNKSIRLLVGLHLLKEWDDLTDEQVLSQLEFNLQWHYALGTESADVHTCQKTLHNFRLLLLSNERAQELFESLTRGLAETDGLDVGRQRLDSTHVISNIAVLTRLGLFVETVSAFLKELRRSQPERLEDLADGFLRRYLEREGYFADVKRAQARRRLPVVAKDIHDLLQTFEAADEVRSLASYGLLRRLFDEQCEVLDGAPEGGGGLAKTVVVRSDAPAALPTVVEPEPESESKPEPEPEPESKLESKSKSKSKSEPEPKPEDQPQYGIRLKKGKELHADSLQSPHDPDATYGRKGKGYEVQIAETCHEDNPYQIITGVSVNGAHESDQHATIAMAQQLQSSDLMPSELFADTGYGSGQNIVDCADMGILLQAPVQDPKAPKKPEAWSAPVEASAKPSVEPRPPAQQPFRLRTTPLGLTDFFFSDAYDEVIACPWGRTPKDQHLDAPRKKLWALFDGHQCATCPFADRCPTKTKRKTGDRSLRVGRATAATAHQQRFQRTNAFLERYKIRSGIESTNNEAKGRHGAKKPRVRGEPRVTLSMKLKSMAINVKRAVQYHTAALLRLDEAGAELATASA